MYEQTCSYTRCIRRGDDIRTVPTITVTLPNGSEEVFCSERCFHDWVFINSSRVRAQFELCAQHNVPWVLP